MLSVNTLESQNERHDARISPSNTRVNSVYIFTKILQYENCQIHGNVVQRFLFGALFGVLFKLFLNDFFKAYLTIIVLGF